MYPENPEGTQVIVGSMNMEYISDTARNRTHNLFRPKRYNNLYRHAHPHPPHSVLFLFRLKGMMKRANYADCQTHKTMHDEFVMKMKGMHCPISAADMHYMKEW